MRKSGRRIRESFYSRMAKQEQAENTNVKRLEMTLADLSELMGCEELDKEEILDLAGQDDSWLAAMEERGYLSCSSGGFYKLSEKAWGIIDSPADPHSPSSLDEGEPTDPEEDPHGEDRRRINAVIRHHTHYLRA